MKIIKFGSITSTHEGALVVTGFHFLHENAAEKMIDVNDPENAEYIFTVVASHLLEKCMPVPAKADFTIEHIVADAIRKAKG